MRSQHFKRRFQTALRLIFPSASDRKYIKLIRQSGVFDRGYYLSSNPGLHWLFRLLPERHFALYGEQLGLRPNARFSSQDYLHLNPDIPKTSPPFLHYLQKGQHEGRRIRNASDKAPKVHLGDPPRRSAEQAIVLHVYYPDLWDEFSENLRKVSFEYDLYITLAGEGAGALTPKIIQEFPDAHIIPVRNHGRDILPFISLVNAGWLDGYDAVCKLHTKKSPYWQDGDDWRHKLVRGILDGPRLAQFKADEGAAIWVADGQLYSGAKWWGKNYDDTAALLGRLNLACAKRDLSFPAGSIYWLKPEMLYRLGDLALSEDDFEPENGQTDGTMAHAVERAIGFLAEDLNLEIRQSSEFV